MVNLEDFISQYKHSVTNKVVGRISSNNGLDYEFSENDLKYPILAGNIADEIHFGFPYAAKGDIFRALLAIAVSMYYDGSEKSLSLIRESVEEEILNAQAAAK